MSARGPSSWEGATRPGHLPWGRAALRHPPTQPWLSLSRGSQGGCGRLPTPLPSVNCDAGWFRTVFLAEWPGGVFGRGGVLAFETLTHPIPGYQATDAPGSSGGAGARSQSLRRGRCSLVLGGRAPLSSQWPALSRGPGSGHAHTPVGCGWADVAGVSHETGFSVKREDWKRDPRLATVHSCQHERAFLASSKARQGIRG